MSVPHEENEAVRFDEDGEEEQASDVGGPAEADGEVQKRTLERTLSADEPELPWFRKVACGCGHFYNDLCACLWFTYLLLFLQKVLNFPHVNAGAVLFIGQVTDAVSTPLIGLVSDRAKLTETLRKYGRRKTWHLLGTVCVTLSFPLIFKCLACASVCSTLSRLLYFLGPVMLFQFGWAAVQISHLALIPELTSSASQRTALYSLRNVFSVSASVTVFLLVWIFMGIGKTDKVSEADMDKFMSVDFIVVGVGLVASAGFHLGTKEPTRRRGFGDSLRSVGEATVAYQISSSRTKKTRMTWRNWLCEPQFYLVALLYMFSRLYINVSQVYFAFYIQYTQDFGKEFVAIFPLVVCVTGFMVSTLLSFQYINRHLDRKLTYLVGASVGCAACVWLWWPGLGNQMYGVSVAMGLAQAGLLVASLSIVCDMIAKNTESGAFVYGAMSFFDKLSNGVTYQLVQKFNPTICETKVHELHNHCTLFYRNVMFYVPGGALFFALLVLLALVPQRIGERRNQKTDGQVSVPS